jgi:hypothetical protein
MRHQFALTLPTSLTASTAAPSSHDSLPYAATQRDIGRRDRSIAFGVFGLLLACYLLTYTGVIQSSDGLAMFATAESIVRRGELDINQLLWMGDQQGNLGPDGELYSRKGLGMTLLAVPLVWLAALWPVVGLAHTALLLNPLLTAWTGGLLFRTGRRLGWGRRTAVAVALIFGLGTLAWPYTQTLFSDPVCGFGLFAAFYGILSYSQTGRKRYLLAAGLAWSLAYLARVVNLMTLPIYVVGVAAAVLVAPEDPTAGDAPAVPRGIGPLARALVVDHWRPLVSFFVPVALAGLTSLWWNWVRYGSIWDSGYVETERFDAVWWFGVAGLLAGPARGLIWYSPILLLAIPGVVWFWRNARPVLFFCLALSALYVAVYGKWYMWHGGYSWGPRFLVPILPFLALLTGPVWQAWVVERRGGIVGRLAVVALLVVSVAVQWLGMLVPFALVQDWLAANVTPLFAPETFTQVRYSPLVLQWQFLTSDNIILAWWRARPWTQTADWLMPLAVLAATGVGVLLLARQVETSGPEDAPSYAAENGVETTRNWLYAVVVGVSALMVLAYAYTNLTDPELRRAAARIDQAEVRDDGILLLLPEQSQDFANVYHGKLPVYGFFPQGELDATNKAWLDRIRRDYGRLWLLPNAGLPEESGWERTLRFEDFLLVDTLMAEPDGQRLALYALSPSRTLQVSGLGTVFGDPALVETGIDDANGWFRLDGYALTPETAPGGELLVALRWEALQPVDYNYQVFVHLLNANDEKLAQRDGQPVQWMRPTSAWQPGETIVDRYAMLLPEELPAGSYTIAVGLYDPVTGQRLPVSAGPRDYAIELGPISVQPGS